MVLFTVDQRSQSMTMLTFTLQSIAAIGNWLFNFASAFFSAWFRDHHVEIFIIFGVLCIGAAVQVFFT